MPNRNKKKIVAKGAITMAGYNWHLVLTLKKKPADVSPPPRKCWFLRCFQSLDSDTLLADAGHIAAYVSVLIVFLMLCALMLAIYGPRDPNGDAVIHWTRVFTCIKTCAWSRTNACGECVTGVVHANF